MADEQENVIPQVNPQVFPQVNVPAAAANVNQSIHAMKVFKYLRTYNGKSDSREFITRLESDVVDHGIATAWLIRNFDRLLEDDAKAWYASVWPSVSTRLTEQGADDVWLELKTQFLNFFNHESQIALHRQRNKTLRFNIGDDPQSYVSAKLEILRYIDIRMSEKRKIEKLIAGLPFQMQQTLAFLGINNVQEFLIRLQGASELHYQNNRFNKNSQKGTGSSLYSAPMLASTSYDKRSRNNNQPNRNQGQSGQVICHYCHKPNHKRFDCRNKAADEQQGIFQNCRPHNGGNNNSNFQQTNNSNNGKTQNRKYGNNSRSNFPQHNQQSINVPNAQQNETPNQALQGFCYNASGDIECDHNQTGHSEVNLNHNCPENC